MPHRFRHGQLNHAQRGAVFGVHGLQALEVRLQRDVIGVLRVGLHGGDDSLRIHKAREIIHMPIRVVANNPVAEPQDVSCTEIIAQLLFDRGAIQHGVAVWV